MRCLLLVALALAAVPARSEVLELDPSTGVVRAQLFKEGALKALGHDHVIVAGAYQGQAEVWISSGAVRFETRADALDIDSPSARESAGLKQKVSDGDRAKIRETMLGPKGLDAERYPLISFRSTEIIAEARQEEGRWLVSGDFTLRGKTLPVHFTMVASPGEGGTWFTGEFRIKPSDYGIKPFKAAAGLIKVKDDALFTLNLLGRKK